MNTRKALISTGIALGVTLATAGAVQADTPGPSHPGPRIISVGTAKYRPADNTVRLPVTYRCTNRPAPGGTQHWIAVGVGSPWAPVNRAWSAGDRNGPTGLIRAQCTGKRITHTLVLKDGTILRPWETPSTTPVTSGYQDVRVHVYQTASQDWGGGWYHATGVQTQLEGSVYLKSPLG